MRKFLAIFLSVMLLAGVTACSAGAKTQETGAQTTDTQGTAESSGTGGSSAPQESDTDTEVELPAVKIGVLPWSLSDVEVVKMMDYFKLIGDACNVEFTFVESSQDETLITNIETLIEAGCQGIMPFYINESVIDVCTDHEVYFAQFCATINADLLSAAEESPYWVGYVCEDDVESCYQMVMHFYDQGARTYAVLGLPAGFQAIGDARYNGFRTAIDELMEKDDTVEMLTEYRGREAVDAAENILTLYPEVDAVCNALGGGGRNEAIVQLIDNHELQRIMFGTINSVEEASYWFENGALDMMVAGNYADAAFAFLLLYNRIVGTPLAEEPVYIQGHYLFITDGETNADFEKYVIGDAFPFSVDELKTQIKLLNPDASVAGLKSLVDSYTIEDIVNKNR